MPNCACQLQVLLAMRPGRNKYNLAGRWCAHIQLTLSHSLHHGKGIHRYNYADLPLWDMVFGTFRNPEGFQAEHGFYPGASARIAEMLAFQEVSVPEGAECQDAEASPGREQPADNIDQPVSA